jgi:hypothetical protein
MPRKTAMGITPLKPLGTIPKATRPKGLSLGKMPRMATAPAGLRPPKMPKPVSTVQPKKKK